MKFVFPKIIIIIIIMVFGLNRVYGYTHNYNHGLSCPQTQQRYESLILQPGGITRMQYQALQQQCYQELKDQFEYQVQMFVQRLEMGSQGQMSGLGGRMCPDGLFKGRVVHPDKCFMGLGAEVMKELFEAFVNR
ncbi:MAG: hypothetical protein BECKG1743D_GA0114223_100078 [Candidatus Kentron sp. G]|nr:MAG: hypothetical protein BECKG1743F_GA0114225_100068 [Candidatus Kentron sp. G]VFM95574.1 MAG: hypothetical protein BECKG1743E_GA0114224_100078 [Candidatus Kentron sp. G]VFM97275.1 MAG: hypothetical protein BECKG1743D_GA0114223_100078 [Candidatus Kentron sp. G]